MNIWKLLRWPVLAPKTAQPQPAPLDDDATFYEQLRYLEELSDLIVDNTRLARIEISGDIYEDFVIRPLLEMLDRPIQTDNIDWPEDHAAHLLALWRMDREMNAWIDGIEAA